MNDITNNGKRGGWLKGKPHYDKDGKSLGGIKAIVTDAGNKPVELEGGEVIINKEASKKHWKELSRINQSAGNGVPISPPSGADEDPSEYKDGGNIIEFNPNHLPNKYIISYALNIKNKYPKVWGLGGNIFGNTAFENLERVSKRGHWLDSEEWMYVKWRSYVARHIHDFRIEGVIAMLKWADKVEKGWPYMKNLIEEEIAKKYPKKEGWKHKMKQGGELSKYKDIGISNDNNSLTVTKYILNRHPKKDDIFKGGKVDGYKIIKIKKIKKHFGIVYHILILDTKKNAEQKSNKRIITYNPEFKKISDFIKSNLTATKGTYYTQWEDSELDSKMKQGGNVKYHLGGDMSKHLAPNGKPSNLTHEQWHLVRTDAFKKWFGDWENDPKNASKVVDDNGEPLVVYHGTNVDFYEFDLKYFGKTDKGWYGKGFYFTPNKNFTFAKDAVSQFGGKEVNLKLFLNIKNPLYGQAYAEQQSNLVSSAKDRDKDGVVVLYDYGHEKESEIAEIIVWDSKNIKLADGTNTTFDSSNPDIRYKQGGITGDVFSIKDPEQFKQIITLYNKFAEKFNVDNYFLNDSSVVFLRKDEFTPTELKEMSKYIADLSKNQNFDIISDKQADISNGYFKFFLKDRVRYKDGGKVDNFKYSKVFAGITIYTNAEQEYVGNNYSLFESKGSFKASVSKGDLENIAIESKELKDFNFTWGVDNWNTIAKKLKTNKINELELYEVGKIIKTYELKPINKMGKGGLMENEPPANFENMLWNELADRYEQGGEVKTKLDLYQVTLNFEDDLEIIYLGHDKQKAYNKFKNFNPKTDIETQYQDRNDIFLILQKSTQTYKFVYNLDEDESIEDFPLEDYFDDDYYWKLVDEEDWQDIETKDILAVNKLSDELLQEVEEYYKKKYGKYKYNTINIEDSEETYKGCIQLRVANHSENLGNIDRYGNCNYYISIVIADYDATKDKFEKGRRSNEIELYFNTNSNLDEVINEVDSQIAEFRENILNEYKEGGNIIKHLAPNGKPSNLTPEQYKLVRTPAFKKWFGDWENDPAHASKIVDENGEPLILYHGTDINFNEYDLTKIGEGSDLLGKGIYLTENENVANFYASLVAKKRYIKGYETGIFGTESPLYEKDADEKAEKHKVIYDFFVNAKNIVNINEININNDLKEIFIKSITFLFGDTSKDVINSRIDFANKNYNKIKNYRGIIIYLIEQFPDSKKEVLEYIKNKYDCIVFEPTDDFEYNLNDYKNYVVFNSNQIKLANGSNTTFDSNNPDIRFDKGGEIKLKIDEATKKMLNDENNFPFLILNEKGETIGTINLMYREDLGGYQIYSSKVKEKGKGIGKKAYIKLRQILGKPIISDSSRTEDAENLWKSLERNNLSFYDEKINKYKIYKTGGFIKEGGNIKTFNYDSLYNTSDEETERINEEIRLSEEQEKEDKYQKSSFSKSWASNRSIAIDKLVKQYLDAKKTYDDWASRQYKENKTNVFLGGDDIFGESKSIGSINEGRKRKVLKGSKMLMEESIADLKEIGLNDSEIDKLLNEKNNEQTTLFNNGGMINFDDSNDYESGTLFSNENI